MLESLRYIICLTAFDDNGTSVPVEWEPPQFHDARSSDRVPGWDKDGSVSWNSSELIVREKIMAPWLTFVDDKRILFTEMTSIKAYA